MARERKKKEEGDVVYSAHLALVIRPEQHEELKEKAKKHDTTVSAIIRFILFKEPFTNSRSPNGKAKKMTYEQWVALEAKSGKKS